MLLVDVVVMITVVAPTLLLLLMLTWELAGTTGVLAK